MKEPEGERRRSERVSERDREVFAAVRSHRLTLTKEPMTGFNEGRWVNVAHCSCGEGPYEWGQKERQQKNHCILVAAEIGRVQDPA